MSSALNILGIGQHGDFAIYHHVLNRAQWSPLQLSRALLLLVAGRFVWRWDDEARRRVAAGAVQGGFEPLLGLQVRKGRRPLDDPEFGTGVEHFEQPFFHGLFLAFLGAGHLAPLGFFQ